jgi:DNA topoisomerase VI subunit B
MSKTLSLAVERDHIESITKANGITAISELIWNSLDADATKIQIEYFKNTLGTFERIIISDNGHGLDYTKSIEVFGKLGGSQKKNSTQSPTGRSYHGKEGKGRYKALALGDLVKFESFIKIKGKIQTFEVVIDRNQLLNSEIGDINLALDQKQHTGFRVTIQNVNFKNAVSSPYFSAIIN